jgi:hypothetical protein
MKRKKGTGSVYKRKGSPVWWIKYHRHGRPFRESTNTTDWRRAERMLRTRLAEINQGTFVGPLLEEQKLMIWQQCLFGTIASTGGEA